MLMNEDTTKSGSQVTKKNKIDPGNLLLVLYMCFIVFLVILGGMMGTSQAGEEDLAELDTNRVQQEEFLL